MEKQIEKVQWITTTFLRVWSWKSVRSLFSFNNILPRDAFVLLVSPFLFFATPTINPVYNKGAPTMGEKSKILHTQDYNALSLAQPTNFKAMLRSGELLWGTGCRIPHPEAARIVASTPYHFCFIDAVSLDCSPFPRKNVDTHVYRRKTNRPNPLFGGDMHRNTHR